MKKQKGITLIALVITIIVMLILVAATIAVSLNGGLFNTAKETTKQTITETEKEQLMEIVVGTMEEKGKVDFEKIVVPEKFIKIDNQTYKSSESNQIYIINENGSINIVPDNNETKIPAKKAPKDTVIKVLKQDSSGGDFTYDGQIKTFENVEINTTENNGSYPGFAGMKGTFENCTINGSLALYADCTFIDCEFNITGDLYNIWTWGAANITFDNCVFFSDGKAMLIYGGYDQNITIEDCVFVDNGGLPDLKAAIEIGNDYNKSYNLNIKNTTVIGYEINNKGINTGTTLWANKNSVGQDKLNVIVDGVDVY